MVVDLAPQVLAEVLGRMLEEAAFIFAEAVEAPPPHDGELIEARLAYSGPHDAVLTLAVPPSLASTIAANLLGEDEGGAASGSDADAVGEFLNMLAGVLVAELFGDAGSCKLGLPQVRRVSPDEHARTLKAAYAAATLVEEEGRRIDLSAEFARSAR